MTGTWQGFIRMLLGWSSRSTDDTVLFQKTTLPEALSKPPASSS